ARIKDPTLRDEYARQLAGWVGWDDVAQVIGRVREEAQRRGGTVRRESRRAAPTTRPPLTGQAASAHRPDPRDPTLWPQREALKAALQYPAFAGPVFDALTVDSFTQPGYAAVRAAIESAGGTSAGLTGAEWIDLVRQHAAALGGLVSELGVETIRVDDDEKLPRYIGGGGAPAGGGWGCPPNAGGKAESEGTLPRQGGGEKHTLC